MKPAVKRLGIIGSSGGSALIAATECFKAAGTDMEWVVVTDRDCGLEQWAREEGYEPHRLVYADADTFSSDASTIFHNSGCDDVLLFYSRHVAAPLFDELRVWNIHPALLPAFPGLHPIEQAMTAEVRILGATLHRVDAGLDTGPIIAQVATALEPGTSIRRAQRLSYMQKVWLTLVWSEQLSPGLPAKPNAQTYGAGVALSCPSLADEDLRASYVDWLARLERTDGN